MTDLSTRDIEIVESIAGNVMDELGYERMVIKKGQELGIVTDTYARRRKQVKAPYDGYVFCINHQAVVNQGEALFHIGK